MDDSGLLRGITAIHLRMLTENPFSGGAGFTYEEVGRMTLDQIWGRLCKIDFLKNPKGSRIDKIKPLQAMNMADKDGLIKGRMEDGTLVRRQIRGVSKARELMEKAKARKKAEEEKALQAQRKKRRKGK